MDSVSVSKISPDIGRSPRSFHSSGNIAREKDSGQLRSARAIDRAGALLKEFDARGEHPRKSTPGHTSSKREAADKAGMSKFQQDQVVRVNNAPQ
jgi:hypothetical protein